MHPNADNLAGRNALIGEHYALARKIAKRTFHRMPQVLELDDLESAAVMGLYEAIDRYDSSRGVPFEAFAKHRILGSVMDTLRAADWTPCSVRRKADLIDRTRSRLSARLGREPSRQEMAETLDVTDRRLGAIIDDSEIRPLLSLDAPTHEEGAPLVELLPGDGDLVETWQQEELKQMVLEAYEELPEREKKAVQHYYFDEMKLKDVGEIMGVTESRVCQVCKSAVQRLRKRLGDHLV